MTLPREESEAIGSGRLGCLDETRALAILAMITQHFSAGTIEQIPALAAVDAPLQFVGRFATPAFVTVFGVSVGFVLLGKPRDRDFQLNRAWLRRSSQMALCAFIVCLPNYVGLILSQAWDPLHWLFATYSVLNFYTLAVVTQPVWLRFLRHHVIRRSILLGASLWLGGMLLYATWPRSDTRDLLEYVRLHLCSGSYAFLPLLGTAILALPMGSLLATRRRRMPVFAFILGAGAVATIVGLGIGLLSGQLTMSALLAGTLKAPPRAWYYLFFGGMTFITLGVLGVVGQWVKRAAVLTYPLGLFGQASLSIYTAHFFVIPSLRWLDLIYPTVGMLRVAIPFLVFTLFCIATMWRAHRRGRKVRPSAPASDRAFYHFDPISQNDPALTSTRRENPV